MILDLNNLTVESFETDGGAAPLRAGMPTNQVVVCAVEPEDPYRMAPTYPYESCGCVDL